jgi:hypothetical protein
MYKLNCDHSIKVRFVKVKGHHTDFVPFEHLSHPEQLNEIMDTQVKARVNHIFAEQIPAPPANIKYEGWSCWIDRIKCTSNPTKPMMHRIHNNAMQNFLAWPDHFRMSTNGFNFVDWDAVERSLESSMEIFCLWAAKHMSHFCGVGRMQFMCRFWDNC